MSPVSFALLSGAGIVKGAGKSDDNTDGKNKVYTHTTYDLVIEKIDGDYYAVLDSEVRDGATIVVTKEAPVYATTLDSAGAQQYVLSSVAEDEIKIASTGTDGTVTLSDATYGERGVLNTKGSDNVAFHLTPTYGGNNQYDEKLTVGNAVRIDCYTLHGDGSQRLQIDAESFAGYYYIEADTLFRDEATGKDFPAEFVIPRGKIQTNFTFTMASSGDPSTFDFTIDCFPAYTKFDKAHKVLAELQIIDPEADYHNYADKEVVGHKQRYSDDEAYANQVYAHSIYADQEDIDDDEAAKITDRATTTDFDSSKPGS